MKIFIDQINFHINITSFWCIYLKQCLWLIFHFQSYVHDSLWYQLIICQIFSNISDCNWTWTHNHLVHKRTLDHLVKLAKWLSCVVSTYLYGASDCMFLSCHVSLVSLTHAIALAQTHSQAYSFHLRDLSHWHNVCFVC